MPPDTPAAPGSTEDDGARGLLTLWAAVAGGWAGLFTPFAAAGLLDKLATHPAQAAHMERLGYGLWFELEILGCLLAATGVIGAPVGLAGSFAATVVRDRRGADWPPIRTAFVGGYLAGLATGAFVTVVLYF